ncbi:hypothetical protein EV426DRAFT_701298 [Tirmania nivea]|nr:hypothetical protein EV426DRAFT_701298 [Tirmania nivea]
MCARVSAVLSFDKGLDLLTDILPCLRVEIQAHIDTPRTNKEPWVMVKDLKWVLEQDNLPPNLPLDERKYHPEKPPPLITITTTIKKISKGRTSKGESYRTGKKAKNKCNGEILNLLDNPTSEKYAKLEPKVVEDLMVADKIRDLLYEWEGIDEDSYEILPDARIIRRLNIVLNGKRLTEHEEEEDDDDDKEEDDEEEEEEED